jgi:hypothetical protein
MKFYRIAKSIIDGSGADTPVKFILLCKRDAELTFVYKQEDGGQMAAYLVITKDDKDIGIRFPTTPYVEYGEDGQEVKKAIQSGLGTFAKVLDGYLSGFGADDKYNKLPANFDECQDYSKQVAKTFKND